MPILIKYALPIILLALISTNFMPRANPESDLSPGNNRCHSSLPLLARLDQLERDGGSAPAAQNSPPVRPALLQDARLYYQKKDYGKAIPLFERALKALEPGRDQEEHIDNIQVMLAQCYYAMHNYSQALQLFDEALAVRENSTIAQEKSKPGGFVLQAEINEHRDALARLYLKHKRPDLAERLYERCNKPEQIADMYMREKLYREAGIALEKQLRRAREQGTSLNPVNIQALNKLELVCNKTGQSAKSEALYTTLVNQHEKDKNAGDLANCLAQLAWFQYRHGKPDRAQTSLAKALTLRTEDKSILVNLYNLATLAEKRGDNDAAKHFYEEALLHCKRLPGVTDIDVVDATAQLADFYWRHSQYAAAEVQIKEELALLEKTPAASPGFQAQHRRRLGCLYCSWGKYLMAEQCLLQQMRNLEESENNAPSLKTEYELEQIRSALSIVYRKEQKSAELELLDRKACGTDTAPNDPALTELIWLYCRAHKYDQAELQLKKNAPSHVDSNFFQALLARINYLRGNFSAAERAYTLLQNDLQKKTKEDASRAAALSQLPDLIPIINYPTDPANTGATVIEGINTSGAMPTAADCYTPSPNTSGGTCKNSKGEERVERLLDESLDDRSGDWQSARDQVELPTDEGGSESYSLPMATAFTRAKLGSVYRDCGKYRDAEANYQSAVTMISRESGSAQGNRLLADTLRNYARLLAKLNRQSQARQLLARAASLDKAKP